MVGGDWHVSILALGVSDWRISVPVISTARSSLRGPFMYRSAVVLFNRGHACFRNFNSSIPMDNVRVSLVKSLFNPTGVPV